MASRSNQTIICQHISYLSSSTYQEATSHLIIDMLLDSVTTDLFVLGHLFSRLVVILYAHVVLFVSRAFSHYPLCMLFVFQFLLQKFCIEAFKVRITQAHRSAPILLPGAGFSRYNDSDRKKISESYPKI